MCVPKSAGRILNVTEDGGIDLLGNIVESSSLTPNRQLYGELINQGHIILSLAHDPENRYLESFGVMGDAATALRDPVFYRWHTFIQEIFHKYKDTLPKYTRQQVRSAVPGERSENVGPKYLGSFLYPVRRRPNPNPQFSTSLRKKFGSYPKYLEIRLHTIRELKQSMSPVSGANPPLGWWRW